MLMVSRECAERSCTSFLLTEAEGDQYFDDESESADHDYDDDDEYWDLYEDEEFYDLCRNCTSPRP